MKTLKYITALPIALLFVLVALSNPTLASADISTGPIGSFMLKTTPGPNSGQITLSWQSNSNINNYDVLYGPTPGNYLWGAQNIGNVTSYTVGGLTPGQRYYFVIQPDSTPPYGGYYSDQVTGVAAGGTSPAPAQPKANTTVAQGITSGPVSGPWNLSVKSGPARGQITLTWLQNPLANNFDIVYGSAPGQWFYGAQDVGNIGSYTVSYLNPGQVYYFAILPQNGSTPLPWTATVATTAGK
jgi:hypothetical protein